MASNPSIPSTSQSLPPNNDAQLKEHEKKVNPTKETDTKSVSEGTASVGAEGDVGAKGGEKGAMEKIKEKMPGK